MNVKIVNVFLSTSGKKVNVGRLALKEKTIYFEYDKAFLQTGIELSPYKLPLKNGVQLCDDTVFEGLFGVFADSLPDGWGKLLLDRHLLKQGVKYSDITQLDRLCHIGEYGIGALSYEPMVKSIMIDDSDIVLDSLAGSSLEILNGSGQELLDTLLAMGGSSAGARPKAMIQLNKQNEIIHANQKLQDGFEHYMVKFPSSVDAKDIGKIEYAYSLMAKDAKIEMPPTLLLHSRSNSYFAVKRFDRIGENRVHIHSVAGLVHSDFRMPSLDYDDLLNLTLHLTKDRAEQLRMFRLAVFNLLTHNRDDHAKNFSFVLDEQNNWKLSPAYDLTFSYGPGGEHSTTYLGEGKSPSERHLLALAKKHNIKNAQKMIDEVKDGLKNFSKYAKEFGISKQSSGLIAQALRENI